ncbi:MAG: hypothetical protein LBU89_12465 [Fibromonadaceae bacterium]|jgi:hypothetical protein|nr:hypothetical protein [Fibromonadaceae bacterium]
MSSGNSYSWIISGRLLKFDKSTPFVTNDSPSIRLFQDGNFSTQLGNASVSDNNGNFSITLNKQQFGSANPNLIIKVFDGQERLLHTTNVFTPSQSVDVYSVGDISVDIMPIPYTWTIRGLAFDGNAPTPFTQGMIRAFDGQTGTVQYAESGFYYNQGQAGSFCLTIDRAVFQNGDVAKTNPFVILKIFNYQNQVIWQRGPFTVPYCDYYINPLVTVPPGDSIVDDIPVVADNWLVKGELRDENNVLVPQPFTVKAFDVLHKNNADVYTLLGTQSNAVGAYQINYHRSAFQQGDTGRIAPNLRVRVFSGDILAGESGVFNQASNPHVIDVNFTPPSVPDIPDVPEIWVVHGAVSYHNGSPMTSGTVLAFDYFAGDFYCLGQSMLGDSGAYSISFSKDLFQRGDLNRLAPNLVLRLRDASGVNIDTCEEPFPSSNQTINFLLPDPSPEADDGNTVFGQVVNRKGLPLKDRPITAYALEFTEATGFKKIRLGSRETQKDGTYRILYNPNLLPSAEKAAIYVEMGCWDTSGIPIDPVASPLVYDAAKHQVFNFVYDGEAPDVNVDEYSKMHAELEKYLDSVLKISAILPALNTDTNEKKLASFLKHPAYLQFTASLEAKEARYTDCYFRAHLIAYELQERFDVARGTQTVSGIADKYDAQNYVSFFYALLRTGIVSSSADLLKQDPAQLLNHLLGSVSERVIAAGSDVRGFLDLWQEMFRTQAGEVPSDGEWTMYHILLLALRGYLKDPKEYDENDEVDELDEGERIAELLGLYYDAEADARQFLESVRGNTPLITIDEWDRVEFLLDLGDFGENYRDMIQASFQFCERQSPQITNLKGMLALAEDGWETIVAKASKFYVARNTPAAPNSELSPPEQGTLPPEFIGANGNEQQAIYARKLYNGLLAWFPQAELAMNMVQELTELNETLPNDEKLDIAKWDAVSVFLSDADKPFFDLGSTNLSVYLQENENYFTENPNSAPTADAQQKICQLQRLFRLTEDLPSILYLVSKGIESSYQITQMTEDQFLADFSVGLGGMNKARQIHRLAVNYTMNASFQVSQYHSGLAMPEGSVPAVEQGPTANGPVMAMAMAQNTNLALPRVSNKVIANWKSLFGTINRNAAIKGQSLLSPSAYLADLLEFLKEGDGYGLLIKRRPDILKLELSKENAEISLPMIDLAIELLEKLVPTEGFLTAENSLGTLANQTSWSSEDLRAQPEYEPSMEAAGPLLDAPYPFVLPTNFSREEARLILEKRGLSWRDLALAFPAANNGYQRRYLVTDAALDKVLQSGAANSFDVWELWGLKESGNNLLRPDKSTLEEGKRWNEILSVASIFLDRSGLTLEGLENLLALPIFDDCGVSIHASAEAVQLGDINGYKLCGIADNAANADNFARKISRFVRLQRLLGWTPEEIDAAWELSLDDLDRVQDLSKTLKVPVSQVIFWGCAMTDAMFAQTFWPLKFDSNENIDVFAEWLNSRLGISQTELDLLLKYLGLKAEENIKRSDAERIYRLGSFAKAVKLGVSDFLELAEWFSLFGSATSWTFADYQEFYALAQELQTNPLSYANIKQLAFAPDEALLNKGTAFLSQLKTALDTMREEYKEIEDSESPAEESLESALETEILNQLASHFSMTEEVAKGLLQDPAWLRSVKGSNEAAWEDWTLDVISLGAYIRLAKAAILVSALKVNTAEQLADWMPNSDDEVPLPDWNAFPIAANDQIDWGDFRPLLQILKALKELNFQNEGYKVLAEIESKELHLEKWNLRIADLNALLEECGLTESKYRDPAKWVHFSQLLALFRKSSNLPDTLKKVLKAVPVSDANGKSDISDYIEAVADLRQNIMRSMSSSGWREFIQPVSDGLRIRKRDALAAYVCWCSQQPETAAYYPIDFFDTNDLYAYYLTDVEMQPDMSTSRIRQALNSVQQFVQRALLGLEGRFTLTDDQKSYWEWMKNYRVWEANRKVFLYAENWIEAELRDDKTPFFKDLEDRLMSSSDNPDAMEEALSEYLEKMLDVGSLQILGACKEDGGDGGAIYTLHIVGRTKGEPGTLYYRRYLAKALQNGEWTPWEKIDTEVQAKSLSMAIMNGNLYLFWPAILHKEEEAEGYEGDTVLGKDQTKSILELRLDWTYFNGKKWSSKKTTKSVLSHVLYDGYGHKLEVGESYEDRFHFQTMNNSSDFLEVKVYRTWYDYDILEPKTLNTKVMDGTIISKEIPVYQPTEFQMIEEFGEFQLWKDGRDQATYYGGSWDRKEPSNYANFYPPANCSLVHNLWADDGEQINENELSVNTDDAQDREPQSRQRRRHGLAGSLRFKQLWTQWRMQYSSWQTAIQEEINLAHVRERVANLVDPSEAGKLVYPEKNIILNKIDGPYTLYPVNFSFYAKGKLPFFFMSEDKTYLIEEVARNGNTGSDGNTAYRFNLLTHPLVAEFHKRYRSGGRKWLYTRETEALPMAEGYYRSYSYYNYYFSVYLGYSIAGDWEAWDLSQSTFDYRHQPANGAVTRPFPSPVVDFSWGSANGIYNWELFFHVPMLIASKLTQEQRYEEAMDWLHMVFDPRMDLSVYERTKRWAQALPKGSRFWRFLPFFANKDADANILETLGMPGARDKTPERSAMEALIDKWKRDPFNPHLIARARPAAYQKYVVMKYLDNLIAWADQLFTVDTMESLNEAIQLYMLAADILGPKEAATTEVLVKPLNVKALMDKKQETLGNVMVQIEDDLIRVNDREKTVPQPKLSAEAGQLIGISGDMFYFGVPRNEKLQAYWGTVADRLYKIRNSLNIEGVKRTLALYEPPIDPAMLVRARAMGLDISSVLSSLSAQPPLYRFQVLVQKAMDIARDVQSLGASLLSALEKKDGESLSLLRAEHERELLTLNKGIRKLQIDEANAHLESLQKSRENAEIRYIFYKEIEKYSSKEDLAMILTRVADGMQHVAAGTHLVASVAALIPSASVGGVINAFGGPQFNVESGNYSHVASCIASSINLTSQICRSEASIALTQAGYERRWKEWKLQEKQAKIEMESLDKQILASEIRIYMAEKELENLERQMEQSDEIYEFMTSRFTSRELYTWMATQLGNLHKNTFQQALKAAQNAERCYLFELGLDAVSPPPAPFIELNYWDGLRQGLLAGESLLYALRRMEQSFLEKNKRELEITRPVSLRQLDPAALRRLQENAECTFKVPEVLFDMDFPGQYFRRIQSVRLEIHCNTNPYASVSARLSLLNNRLRKSDIVANEYEDASNYLDNRIGIRSIATSQAQSDGGLFELNFRDERYLPFEGAGAISEWRLELPDQYRQFDYQTISNAVLHISYTARNSSGVLKQAAIGNIAKMWNGYRTLSGEGLVQEFCLSRDYPDTLQQLRAGMPVDLQIGAKDFPAFTQGYALAVESVRILAKARNEEVDGFTLGSKLGGISIPSQPQSPLLSTDKWTEIGNSDNQGLNLGIQGEWLLDASQNGNEKLNNLGDIMIEYRYAFEEV